jgi:pyruvate,orthophosphate dikinase
MFGDVVMDVSHEIFEQILDQKKRALGVRLDTELGARALSELVEEYKKVYQERTGEEFPLDPKVQLRRSISAVFESWNNERAIKYRELYDIKGLRGTGVNVQTMVFGNMGETSGTGVCFSRDPSTGANKFYGEYLMNAQGEDVVAGIRTPEAISTLAKRNRRTYRELVGYRNKLEKHYRDMQDMEFTIEGGELFMLQTRSGKRTATAAVKIAVDMVREKLISKEEALLRIEPDDLDQLLHPAFDPASERGAEIIAKGLPASPGAATGRVIFSAEDAEAWTKRGEKVVLARVETSPEDIGGMHVAEGVLTSRGGMTSHAAVVARGMGKCCVAGAGEVQIDYQKKVMEVGGRTIGEGDDISLNGTSGNVYVGKLKTVEPELTGSFGTLMKWAEEVTRLKVRANADTPHDAEVAVRFGAVGIGLCRTEHMFFERDRIVAVREMILADDRAGRERALEKLLPMQREDFEGIFKAMKGRPVTVRLIDPPLHEFLPTDAESQEEMAAVLGVPLEQVKAKVEELHEFNPMLGHRGCRLGITYPEIVGMQTRAIIEAALRVKKSGIKVLPEIMIPLVGEHGEIKQVKDVVEQTIQQVFAESKRKVPYMVGTMIEVPRASLIADKIAEEAEFFSFGTNDLTQMTCGFSRDDAGRFLKEYVKLGIFEKDPFQVLDQEGVGQLVEMGIKKGRSTRKDLKVGICGEHGGEPESIGFCHRVGMDYVSCSPYRVPIARLAAAQAALREKREAKARRAKTRKKKRAR